MLFPENRNTIEKRLEFDILFVSNTNPQSLPSFWRLGVGKLFNSSEFNVIVRKKNDFSGNNP